MKKLIAIAMMCMATVAMAAETRKVCIDKIGKDGKVVIDKKTNKPEQECKEMKVHKKLEGTEVPQKK